MKNTSNPLVGRHGVGSRVGKFTPNKASQGASGNYGVGTGRNQKTAGRKEMTPSRTPSGENFQQIDSMIRQSPEPFRAPGQPATIPTGRQRPQQWGQPYEQISQPGSHPNRAPGQNPPSTEDIMRATGHKPSYRPIGQSNSSLTSGRVQQARGTKNTGGGNNQPSAKSPFKTNQDIFNYDTMKHY